VNYSELVKNGQLTERIADLEKQNEALAARVAELEKQVVDVGVIAMTHPAQRDAARYRWLRVQDWFDGTLCVLRDPKKILTRGIGLGADCPSRDRLDAAIDAAIAAAKP